MRCYPGSYILYMVADFIVEKREMLNIMSWNLLASDMKNTDKQIQAEAGIIKSLTYLPAPILCTDVVNIFSYLVFSFEFGERDTNCI